MNNNINFVLRSIRIRVLVHGAEPATAVAAMTLPQSRRKMMHGRFFHQNRVGASPVEIQPHRHVPLQRTPERHSLGRGGDLRVADGRRERGRPPAEAFPEGLLQVEDITAVYQRIDAWIGDGEHEERRLDPGVDHVGRDGVEEVPEDHDDVGCPAAEEGQYDGDGHAEGAGSGPLDVGDVRPAEAEAAAVAGFLWEVV